MRHHRQRLLEPEALDEVSEGYARQRLEHPIKMELREHRSPRYARKAQLLFQVADDVVDGEVDPFNICRRGRGLAFCADSQDLARTSTPGPVSYGSRP